MTDGKEMEDFKEDFRVRRAEAILKKYVKKREVPHVEKLMIALHVALRRLKDVDDALDDPDLDNLVPDHEWEHIQNDKLPESSKQQLLAQTWYRKLQVKFQHLCEGPKMTSVHNTDSDEIEEEEEDKEEEQPGDEADRHSQRGDIVSSDEEEYEEEEEEEGSEQREEAKNDTAKKAYIESEKTLLQQEGSKRADETPRTKLEDFQQIEDKRGAYVHLHEFAQSICKGLKEKFTQFNMNGTENLWLLKPGSSSRGRGIKIYRTYERFVNRIETLRGNTKCWVVQKCIENPLIVDDRKFDIRQWVLVTDWNPLTIWCYRESYIRFTTEEYDKKGANRKNQLTNHTVQKKYLEGEDADPNGCMWSSEEFADYLEGEFGPNTWREKIWT